VDLWVILNAQPLTHEAQRALISRSLKADRGG
jgi:hypothetical protein